MRHLVTATLVKHSLCKCGFPLMNDNVPLGKQYVIDTETIESGKIRCGGCFSIFPVNLVTIMEDGHDAGALPIEALKIEQAGVN